nr:MAG TPA: hemolysin [Caudoviricetes sp.]
MKDDPLKKIIAGVNDNIDSFTQFQKELHKVVCNPDMSRLQSAIEFKRETDAQNRIKELEIQNKDLVERIKKTQKSQIWITILSAIIGSVITVLLQELLQIYISHSL